MKPSVPSPPRKRPQPAGVRIHPTAIIEPGVRLGAGTRVWDSVHIRSGATIGEDCIIGEKTYIAYDVMIGNLVKINAMVYVCAGVTIEDMAMISAGTVFTNDRFPRAAIPERAALITSEPTEQTLRTIVRRGTTIGANATIGPGLELGEFCMVGMGAVVTKSVRPFQLVVGCPARLHGWVCVCGEPLGDTLPSGPIACERCARSYVMTDGILQWQHGGRKTHAHSVSSWLVQAGLRAGRSAVRPATVSRRWRDEGARRPSDGTPRWGGPSDPASARRAPAGMSDHR